LLGHRAVQAQVDRARQILVGPSTRRQGGSVEPVTPRNEQSELVTADGIGAGDVVNASMRRRGQFQ
jgi:hypothetical protein